MGLVLSLVLAVVATNPASAWNLPDMWQAFLSAAPWSYLGGGMGGGECDQGMCEMMCDMMGHGSCGTMDPAECETLCDEQGHHGGEGPGGGDHHGGHHHDDPGHGHMGSSPDPGMH
jgi:hypothetical protein